MGVSENVGYPQKCYLYNYWGKIMRNHQICGIHYFETNPNVFIRHIYIYVTHCLPWLSKGSHNLSHICDWKYFRSWHNNLMWFFEPMNKHVLIPYEANPSTNSIPWWIYPIHMGLINWWLYAIFKQSHVIHSLGYEALIVPMAHFWLPWAAGSCG